MPKSFLIKVSAVKPAFYSWNEIVLGEVNPETNPIMSFLTNVDSYFIVDSTNWSNYFATKPIFIKIDEYDGMELPEQIAADLLIYNNDKCKDIRSAELL